MEPHRSLACRIDAIPEPERPLHVELAIWLFRHAVDEPRGVPNGYAFCLPPEAFDQVANSFGESADATRSSSLRSA